MGGWVEGEEGEGGATTCPCPCLVRQQPTLLGYPSCLSVFLLSFRLPATRARAELECRLIDEEVERLLTQHVDARVREVLSSEHVRTSLAQRLTVSEQRSTNTDTLESVPRAGVQQAHVDSVPAAAWQCYYQVLQNVTTAAL